MKSVYIPKAVRCVARSSLSRSFDYGLNTQLVRFLQAPLYKHATDAAAAVFGVHVEDREDWGAKGG